MIASRAGDLGSIPAVPVNLFPDRVTPVTCKMGTPVAALPGAWRYNVSVGTGWPGVSILGLAGTVMMMMAVIIITIIIIIIIIMMMMMIIIIIITQ